LVELAKSKEVEDVDEGVVEEKFRLQSIGFVI
jgi:hypothetical protein